MTNTFPSDFLKDAAGMRWIGDVHGSLEVDYAIDSALDQNLKLGFLGDLTDQSPDDTSGSANDSVHVLRRVFQLVRDGQALLTPGNHCAKLYRYMTKLRKGDGSHENIKTYHGLAQTLDEMMTSADTDEIIDGIIEVIGASKIYHRGLDHVFVHAGAVTGMFDGEPRSLAEILVDRKAGGLMNRALYGQTTGQTKDDGFPERIYDWIDLVPNGKTVVIGHDKQKMVHSKTGELGGTAVFLDTGSGKGGRLSWLDFTPEQMGA
jgi:hypothetical protein